MFNRIVGKRKSYKIWLLFGGFNAKVRFIQFAFNHSFYNLKIEIETTNRKKFKESFFAKAWCEWSLF